MDKPTHHFQTPGRGGRRTTLGLFFCFLLWCASPGLAAQPTGTLSGHVSNAGTGALLEGATVAIPALNLETLTNTIGDYTLHGVPPGAHEVVVRYTGLDPLRENVSVTAGARTAHDFSLTSGVYQLGEFVVTGEREGNAAAITRQRYAPNVKNVVALDAFGSLPNDSAGELLIRLPGIAGRYDDEGNVTGVMIRGAAPGLNTVSVDGNQQASAGGSATAPWRAGRRRSSSTRRCAASIRSTRCSA